MDYVKEITIPANTLETSKQETTLNVVKGVIHRVRVYFPFGCMGLAKVQIFRGQQQLWPSTDGEYYAGNGTEVDFKEFLEIEATSEDLIIKTWNEDDTYDHTIRVTLSVLQADEVDPYRAFVMLAERLDRLLKRLGA